MRAEERPHIRVVEATEQGLRVIIPPITEKGFFHTGRTPIFSPLEFWVIYKKGVEGRYILGPNQA